jgi:hypothetical protein
MSKATEGSERQSGLAFDSARNPPNEPTQGRTLPGSNPCAYFCLLLADYVDASDHRLRMCPWHRSTHYA